MVFQINDIDSAIFGKTVADIKNFDQSINFVTFEKDYVAKYSPFYVLAKVPSTELNTVHMLESEGFRFLELQIQIKRRPKLLGIQGMGYSYAEVDNQEDLEQVVAIARETFTDDRVLLDKELADLCDPDIAAKRYETYVRRSYSESNQRLYKVYDKATNEIAAFFSFLFLGNKEALALLGGVTPKYKDLGLGAIYSEMYTSELLKNGVKTLFSNISARNSAIINLDVGFVGFKATGSVVVLRKIYNK